MDWSLVVQLTQLYSAKFITQHVKALNAQSSNGCLLNGMSCDVERQQTDSDTWKSVCSKQVYAYVFMGLSQNITRVCNFDTGIYTGSNCNILWYYDKPWFGTTNYSILGCISRSDYEDQSWRLVTLMTPHAKLSDRALNLWAITRVVRPSITVSKAS